MRAPWRRNSAFTLVELLVVVAIIAILAALLLPALTRGKARAQRVTCISDLKQLGTAFQMFAHDHQGRYPMQVPIADGGSMELVQAGENINGVFYFSYRHFQTLANELVATKPLVCPADLDRAAAVSYGLMQNSNVSYFVGVNADYNLPMSILAGDRNITNNGYATASLVRGAYGLRWTSELHVFKGNVLFSDTHVGEINNDNLDFSGSPLASSTFFLPAVRQLVLAGGSGPPSGGGGPPNSGPPSGGPPNSGPPNSGPPTPPPSDGGGGPSPASGGPGPSTGGGGPGSSSGGGGQFSTTTGPGAQPAANRMSAGQPMAPLRDNNMSSRQMAGRASWPDTTPEADASQPAAMASNNAARRAAVRGPDDEPEPPLMWLMGAAKTGGARAGWWLLPILLFLLAALYLYARVKWKMRERRKRRAEADY